MRALYNLRRRTNARAFRPCLPLRVRGGVACEEDEEGALVLGGRFVDARGAVAARGYEVERRARLVPGRVAGGDPETLRAFQHFRGGGGRFLGRARGGGGGGVFCCGGGPWGGGAGGGGDPGAPPGAPQGRW